MISGKLPVIKKILKISFFIILIVGSNFLSFGFGRVSKKNDLYDNCMKYHAALTKHDADYACSGIMAGIRWTDHEVMIPGVHGDPNEDITQILKKDSK
jgi:hypothetical protein